MVFSGSSQPDLDWSQIRETVKLLAVSVAQVEGGMSVGDESVGVLVESFTAMVTEMNAIQDVLQNLPAGESRDETLQRCTDMQGRIHAAIVAFQFYDRLQQCLQHVSIGLQGLSDLIETPTRLYNPVEWFKFQEQIRGRYTMESEKVMFDAIHQGKSIEEAVALAKTVDQKIDEDDVELF